MDLAEAEGIARYLAKAGLPEGDSIAERQNQLPVVLLAEIDRLRARVAELENPVPPSATQQVASHIAWHARQCAEAEATGGQDRENRCPGCGNSFGGDNLCMPSACQWEGTEHDPYAPVSR